MSQKATNAVLAVLVAAALVFSVLSYTASNEQAIPRGANVPISFAQGGTQLTIGTGGTLQVNGTFSSTSNLPTSGALVQAGQTYSGSIHYGSLGNPANGDRIAHGFTTTPTACTVTPTTTGVVTATITSITSTGFAVSVGATTGVYWMCGR
jgi:hypothetical protein